MSILENKLHEPDFEMEVIYCVHDSSFNIAKRHLHENYYEIVLVKEGRANHTQGNRRMKITAGDLFAMLPGQEHHYTDAHSLGIFNIIFSESFLEILPFGGARLAPGEVDHVRPEPEILYSMVMLLEEMLLEQQRRLPDSRLLLTANLMKFLALLNRAIEKPAVKNEPTIVPEFRILRLLETLNRNYAEPWPLKRMAEHCGLSVSGFRKCFAAAMGNTPGAWLLNLRLEKAAAILASTPHSIAETALACGFLDSNYFTRQFRKHFKTTPLKFRKNPHEAWPFTKPLLQK